LPIWLNEEEENIGFRLFNFLAMILSCQFYAQRITTMLVRPGPQTSNRY